MPSHHSNPTPSLYTLDSNASTLCPPLTRTSSLDSNTTAVLIHPPSNPHISFTSTQPTPRISPPPRPRTPSPTPMELASAAVAAHHNERWSRRGRRVVRVGRFGVEVLECVVIGVAVILCLPPIIDRVSAQVKKSKAKRQEAREGRMREEERAREQTLSEFLEGGQRGRNMLERVGSQETLVEGSGREETEQQRLQRRIWESVSAVEEEGPVRRVSEEEARRVVFTWL